MLNLNHIQHTGYPATTQRTTNAHISLANDEMAVQKTLRQLRHTLLTLNKAAEMIGDSANYPIDQQVLRQWLLPGIQGVEDVLTKLRNLPALQHTDTVELVQCMTVLVLAVDMLVNGQLAISYNDENYAMLRRNIDRAMASLNDIRLYWQTAH